MHNRRPGDTALDSSGPSKLVPPAVLAPRVPAALGAAGVPPTTEIAGAARLPLSLLARYLFFLSRRPISSSNTHFLQQRLDGLKALRTLLADTSIPALKSALTQVGTLNAANFQRLAQGLHVALWPLAMAAGEIPPSTVVSDAPPRPDVLGDARRVLLLLGPGIGIGDECILFQLPAALKAAYPGMEIDVLSAYAGLWDRVHGVAHSGHYSDFSAIVDALRGTSPAGTHDLVMLADFERPDLQGALCHEPDVRCYLELSLGAQSVTLVDNRHGWLHRARRPLPYYANYYVGLDYLTAWLGLGGRPADPAAFIRRAARPPTDRLSIYVNPFTSKHEPSQAYWSRLLGLLTASPAWPIRMAIDPGPNATTRRFATALARAVDMQTTGEVRVVVADADTGSTPGTGEGGAPAAAPARPAGFEGVFGRLEQAHVAVCMDSFVAHAAPLFDCTTLVVAGPGLENWRAPHRGSYYFSSAAPLDEVAAAMRLAVASVAPGRSPNGAPSPLTGEAPRLDAATDRLGELLASGASYDELQAAYETLRAVYHPVVDGLPTWPPDYQALCRDVAYPDLLEPAGDGGPVPPHLQPDATRHLHDRWLGWQNTNLRKRLRTLAHGTVRSRGPTPVVRWPATPMRR